jgi:hypothetical protein
MRLRMDSEDSSGILLEMSWYFTAGDFDVDIEEGT